MNPFFQSLFFSLLSTWIAQRYFLDVWQMAVCAMTALGLSPLISQLLDRNRKSIWEDKSSAWIANLKLALAFCLIFLGIFVAAAFAEIVLRDRESMESIEVAYRNSFEPLLKHNFQVLIIGCLLTLLYRAGGLVLILAWNAIHWAEAIFYYVEFVYLDRSPGAAFLTLLIILPHLMFEVLAYVVAGLAGVFCSIAVFKYSISSIEFIRVLKAAFVLVLVSIATLLVATSLEIYLAQPLFHRLTEG